VTTHNEIIEKAKARGWRMTAHGRGNRNFVLCNPDSEGVLRVSISRRMPCPMCQGKAHRKMTFEDFTAMAWDELLEWVGPDRLLGAIDQQQ
jgi:hypothetical protein